jgi:hypothetical protein
MTSLDQVPCGVTEMDQTRFTLIKVDMSITSFERVPRIRERHRWSIMRCGKCMIRSVACSKESDQQC